MPLHRVPLARMLVALGLGIVTFAVARAGLRGAAPPPLVTVTVMARDVRAGTVLRAGDVRPAQLPATAVPRAPLASDPAGKTAAVDLVRGEVLLAGRVGARGLAALLPPGTRALAVPRAAGTPPLERGQLVDVVAAGAVVVEGATVIAAEEDSGTTVAVPVAAAPALAEAIAAGTVTLLLAG